LIIKMQAGERMSLEQIQALLEASEPLKFKGRNRKEVYDWVNQTVRGLGYGELKRKERSLVKQYIAKMTGLSRAQTTRMLGQYLRGEEIKPKLYRRHRFTKRYTPQDIELLATIDEVHDTLSGPATLKLLQRACYDFGEKQYQRLAQLSVAQLYRLRKSRIYRERWIHYEATRPTKVAIGERRRPEPNGRPGYLRVDTVHQGDLDGVKGVYHINAVDEVTQWQVLGATPQISEAFLKPVLEAMLEQFPFGILGFHSDNGSEFINYTVAKLLNKLLIEQTKSRPRHSNDNGLVEAKNGAVVRKHMGYTHIAAPHAAAVHEFYKKTFNSYLNFHRPCGVPELDVNSKGRTKRVYRWYATPWEILRQLPDLAKHLRTEVTIQDLERQARGKTDTAAAEEMQKAKQALFESFQQSKRA
jgi:transposase InsO family protein